MLKAEVALATKVSRTQCEPISFLVPNIEGMKFLEFDKCLLFFV